MIEKQGVCPTHGSVLARAKGTSHLLHLVLTLLTGVWLFVWIVLAMRKKDWRCPVCGQPVEVN